MLSAREIPTALPFTASISPAVPSSLFQRLWKRICSVVKKIFSSLSNFGGARDFFTAKEITFLRDDRFLTPLSSTRPQPLIDKKITIETNTPNQPLVIDEAQKNKEPIYREFDETLENLRAFVRDFAVLGIDVFYENHIVNCLESARKLAPSFPPVIKSVAKLLIEMGDKAAKPLFKKFAEQKARTIDPALQKIFNMLLKPDQNDVREKLSKLPHENFESIFLEEKNKLFNELKNTLHFDFKSSKTPIKQNIDLHYIQPVLNWLMFTDHSKPLTDLFDEMGPQKEELIDKIFERAITLLVEKKIDQYSNILERTMQRHLGEIIRQTIQKNATRIADFFSERISELIEAMPFTEMMDALIHDTLHLQIQGIIESENEYERERQSLDKVARIAQIEPKTAEALEAQILAQNHLKTVELYGGKEAFLDHVYMKKFSEQPACTQMLKQIMGQESTLISLGKDPRTVRSSSEKALYTSIADNLLDLMAPSRKKLGANGEVEETDPFVELWDLLYFPEEFYDLLKQSEELTQEFATTETTALLEKIRQPAVEIVKNIFKSTTKDLLRKKLGEIVQKAFEKISIPERLNEIYAEDVFPSINLMLIEVFAKQTLGRNIKEFAPLFLQLITSDPLDRNQHVRTIQQLLVKHAKNKFKQFNPDEFHISEKQKDQMNELAINGLTPMDWLNLTQGIVINLEKEILLSQVNHDPFNPKTTSLLEVSAILKHLFNTEPTMNNQKYGTFSTDLLFKLGKFPGEWIIGWFLGNTISSNLTEAIEPWRKSYHKYINTMTESLKKSLINPAVVKSLLIEEPSRPILLTENKLAHQINVMASLAYDIIMGFAQEKGSIETFATKKIITNTPAEINRSITRIYKRLFGNQLINQNLAILAYEKIFKSLSSASENIRMKENMKAHRLAADRQDGNGSNKMVG